MRTTLSPRIIHGSRLFAASSVLALANLVAGSASAQEDSYYDAPSAGSSSSSSRSSGGKAQGLFVGAESLLLGSAPGGVDAPGGAITVGWDASQWRVEGLIGLLFRDGAGTSFGFGARGFYVVHKTKFADFGVGGLLGLVVGGGAVFLIEPSAQIRAFIVENVALTATLGMGIAVGDVRATIALLGQVTGGLGITYTFD